MSDRDDLILEGDDALAMAAARDYDAAWPHRLGLAATRSVELARLQPGDSVLDVACGTGGSVLIAAKAVGPRGSVLGVDLSPAMIARGRDKALALGLGHVRFETADMTRLPFPDQTFDAVLCVLGLFFADDMAAQVAELWRLLRLGGRLVVTTLGPDLFAPLMEVLVREARTEDPQVWVDFAPRRISRPDDLDAVVRAGGVAGATVTLESHRIPLASPDDWWQIVMGTGLRRTALSLSPEAASRVRERCADWIRASGLEALSLDFIYATATRQ